MKSIHVLALGVAITLVFSSLSFSLPRFTAIAEQKCNLCHVSPTGGGMRNEFGSQFFAQTELAAHQTEVICDNTDISNGEISEILLNGDFTCHGITRPIEVKASVQYFNSQNTCPIDLPGESLHVKAFFEIYLADHEIKRPKFLILKLDEKQVIELDFWASTELPEVNFGED